MGITNGTTIAKEVSLEDRVNDLNQMILQGQILEAFEKYYADDVVMTDNNQEPRVGKAANRVYEEQFVNGLTAFRGAEIKSVAVNEETGVAMVEWWMDFTHSTFGDVERHQVAVQHWKDGQIVREHFFYGS